MTITVKIPQSVEQAYVSAARTKGVSVDALVEDVLVLNAPVAESAQRPNWLRNLASPCFAAVNRLTLRLLLTRWL